MSLEAAKQAIWEAAQLGTVKEIWFEGGEPFLYFPLLQAAVRYAGELGLKTGIVTNGYFAESVSDARVWLAPLKSSGLTWLSVSDDSYHSEDYPRSPKAAALLAAARELGIEADTICIESAAPSGRYGDKGRPIGGGAVRFRGRAAEKLAGDGTVGKTWECFGECPDEDWEKLGRLHVDPHGWVFACQGITLGNLREQSLTEIVAGYRPAAHAIIGPLSAGGPAELARRYGIPLPGVYRDACHACYSARQYLRKNFPEELGPPEVYGESPA